MFARMVCLKSEISEEVCPLLFHLAVNEQDYSPPSCGTVVTGLKVKRR